MTQTLCQTQQLSLQFSIIQNLERLVLSLRKNYLNLLIRNYKASLQRIIQFNEEKIQNIICCANSGQSTAAGIGAAIYQLELLSWISTSTLLSDKLKYPTFSRIVPPDTFQTKAC